MRKHYGIVAAIAELWCAGGMTIPVPVAELAATCVHFGAALLIVGDGEGWPRVFTVDPVVDGDALVLAGLSDRMRDRALAQPRVTVVWQPLVRHGHTLVVDGWAEAGGTGAAGGGVLVRVDHAVLHRPQAHADGPVWPPGSGRPGSGSAGASGSVISDNSIHSESQPGQR